MLWYGPNLNQNKKNKANNNKPIKILSNSQIPNKKVHNLPQMKEKKRRLTLGSHRKILT